MCGVNAHFMKHKNAQLRYNTLDRCFRSTTKKYDIDKLLIECNKALNEQGYDGVQKRQLYSDINYMKNEPAWLVDLEVSGWPRVYKYKDPSFSIMKAAELNEDQKVILKEALLSLKTMSGIPQLDHIDIDQICAQLRIGLDDKEKREEVYLKEVNESYRDFYGGRHQEKLLLYIKEKTSIKVVQNDKRKETKEIIISPYLMKEYNSRWYLLGQSKDFESPTIIPLDQIIKISEDDSSYIKKPKTINKNYFDDIVGVTIPGEGKKEEVKLKIKESFWPLIKTRPIHESQKTPRKEGSFYIVSYNLIPNQELINKIFQWGENITVLKPQSLRNSLIKKVEEMKNNYKNAH